MIRLEKKQNLLKPLAAVFLVASVAILPGCGANNRLIKLAAPQPLARSAGGSYATTDVYLSGLEIPNPSERTGAVISQLPKDDAIMFIAQEQTPEIELTYRSIAYLSWPRQIGSLYCGAKTETPVLLFKPEAEKKVRWLIFYRIQTPAALTVANEIGSHLKLIHIEEAKQWTYYCSR